MQHIREFLSAFRPGLEYYIVPIQDVYGPTGWDPDVQALVVSKETISGADASTYFLSIRSVSLIDISISRSCFPPGGERIPCVTDICY
jgi:hypothetical protein